MDEVRLRIHPPPPPPPPPRGFFSDSSKLIRLEERLGVEVRNPSRHPRGETFGGSWQSIGQVTYPFSTRVPHTKRLAGWS